MGPFLRKRRPLPNTGVASLRTRSKAMLRTVAGFVEYPPLPPPLPVLPLPLRSCAGGDSAGVGPSGGNLDGAKNGRNWATRLGVSRPSVVYVIVCSRRGGDHRDGCTLPPYSRVPVGNCVKVVIQKVNVLLLPARALPQIWLKVDPLPRFLGDRGVFCICGDNASTLANQQNGTKCEHVPGFTCTRT